MVVLRQNSMELGKIGHNWANWLHSGKTVVIGQSGCIRVKWFYSG